MRLFGNGSNKVSPLTSPNAAAKTQSPKYNNYLDNKTFYMCTPGNADFFVDKLLVDLSLNIVTEQQSMVSSEAKINGLHQQIAAKQSELDSQPVRSNKQKKLAAELTKLQETLKSMEIDNAYLTEKAGSFIPFADYHTSPAAAISACLSKETQHGLILTAITATPAKLNFDRVRGVEVTRPNLLSCIDAVVSISQQDVKKILKAQAASPIDPASKATQESPATLKVIDEVLANSTVFQKSAIISPLSENSTVGATNNHLTPLINPKPANIYKKISISPEVTIVFEKVQAEQRAVSSPEESSLKRVRSSR
jgi:hypothetical protein